MIGFAVASPLILDEEPIKLRQGQTWGRIKRAPILRIWYAPPRHWTDLGKMSQDSMDSTKAKELKLKELKKLELTIRKLRIWEIILMQKHSDQLEGKVTKIRQTNSIAPNYLISHFS